jgi:hypothetical protein
MESNKGEVLKKIDTLLLSLLELIAGSNDLSTPVKSSLVSLELE